MNEMQEIIRLLREQKESFRQSNLSASGITVMALVLGLAGIALVYQQRWLYKLVLWLIGFATLYNFGILIFILYEWIARRRKTR